MQGEAAPVFLGPVQDSEVRAGLIRTGGKGAIAESPGPLCFPEPVQTGSDLSKYRPQ